MADVKFLINSHQEFIERDGIPIVESFGINLLDVETKPWARMGDKMHGAYTLAAGRGDFLDMYVLDMPPGTSSAPQKHLFEVVVYVLEGRGSTTVDDGKGRKHNFEWGPKSLFVLPLNARYQHFNNSGQSRAKLACVTNLPLVLNAFHNEDFVFANPFEFPERLGEDEKFFKGDGEFIPMRPGRHMWETNFVPDLSTFALQEWKARGAGGSNIMFVLGDGTMHAHISEMPVGTYKKGHRHGADFHVFAVTGEGYSIYWYEGEKEFERFDWKHGAVFAPADRMFHQHFNVSGEPARYLAVAFGGLRYPFVEDKKKTFMGMDVNVKEGGRQIEYEDQDPRIHQLYVSELRKRGVEPKMDHILTDAGVAVGAR